MHDDAHKRPRSPRAPEETIPLHHDRTQSLASTPPPGAITVLPPGYRRHKLLGEGAVGLVWEAGEAALGRAVALKTLRSVDCDAARASLLTEAKILADLEHPAIPPIYAVGEHEGVPFVAMRKVTGASLQELAQEPEHPLWAEWEMGSRDRCVAIVEILARIAEALAFAHERGVLHRDVKPANILVGPLGQAFLVDWGIAVKEAMASGDIVGTPAYMAPEMAVGGSVDKRSDVYLLGATLHAMLTGQPRHVGDTIEEVLALAALSRPFRYGPEIPEGLAALCTDATAKAPERRPADALAFRARLRAYRRDRSAVQLCERAHGPLGEIEGLVGQPDTASAERVERLASLCRLLLNQAGEMSPESLEPRSALGRLGLALARFYIARGEPGPARAALADAPASHQEELRTAIQALEASRARDAQRALELERALEHHDVGRDAKSRAPLLITLAVILVIVPIGLRIAMPAPEPPPHVVLLVSLAITTGGISIIAIFWRRLRSSLPNRTLAVTIIIIFLAQVGLRGVERVFGETRTLPGFAKQLVVMAALSALGAYTSKLRLMWGIAGAFACGALVAALLPGETLTIFSCTIVVGLLCGAAFATSAPKKKAD